MCEMTIFFLSNIVQDSEWIKELPVTIALLVLVGVLMFFAYDLAKHYYTKIKTRELEVQEAEIKSRVEVVRIEQERKDKRAEMLNKTQSAMVDKLENLSQKQEEVAMVLEALVDKTGELEQQHKQMESKIGEIRQTCKINTDKLLILGDRHETHRVLLGTEGV